MNVPMCLFSFQVQVLYRSHGLILHLGIFTVFMGQVTPCLYRTHKILSTLYKYYYAMLSKTIIKDRKKMESPTAI